MSFYNMNLGSRVKRIQELFEETFNIACDKWRDDIERRGEQYLPQPRLDNFRLLGRHIDQFFKDLKELDIFWGVHLNDLKELLELRDEIKKLRKYKNKANTKTNRQHLYLFYNPLTDLYKIGISKNPKKRLSNLSSKNGVNLEIQGFSNKFEGAYDKEKELHSTYKEYRARGEWFNFPDDKIDEVKAIINQWR